MDENLVLASDLVEVMKLMFIHGLINPKGGNGSVRVDRRTVLITPSGVSKYRLRTDDLVTYDLFDKRFIYRNNTLKPSVEAWVHISIYEAREDAFSVLHAHPLHVNLLLEKGETDWWRLPIAEYELGDTVVCIAKPFKAGSRELADEVKHLVVEGCGAVIVPHHGVFVWNRDVWSAFDKISALEYLARYRFLTFLYDNKLTR